MSKYKKAVTLYPTALPALGVVLLRVSTLPA